MVVNPSKLFRMALATVSEYLHASVPQEGNSAIHTRCTTLMTFTSQNFKPSSYSNYYLLAFGSNFSPQFLAQNAAMEYATRLWASINGFFQSQGECTALFDNHKIDSVRVLLPVSGLDLLAQVPIARSPEIQEGLLLVNQHRC